MKALSVKQPWADLLACGQKTWEMRTWTTNYRGPLLILASAKSATGPEAARWSLEGRELGVVSCVVNLVEVGVIRSNHYSSDACCNIAAGEYAWRVTGPMWLPAVPVKGRLGLFDVPEDLLWKLAEHPETSCAALKVVVKSLTERRQS